MIFKAKNVSKVTRSIWSIKLGITLAASLRTLLMRVTSIRLRWTRRWKVSLVIWGKGFKSNDKRCLYRRRKELGLINIAWYINSSLVSQMVPRLTLLIPKVWINTCCLNHAKSLKFTWNPITVQNSSNLAISWNLARKSTKIAVSTNFQNLSNPKSTIVSRFQRSMPTPSSRPQA
jgi:hypothetical protein